MLRESVVSFPIRPDRHWPKAMQSLSCGLYYASDTCYTFNKQLLQSMSRHWCRSLWAFYRVPTGPGKSCNFGGPFSRPGKSWKTAKVMESPGK